MGSRLAVYFLTSVAVCFPSKFIGITYNMSERSGAARDVTVQSSAFASAFASGLGGGTPIGALCRTSLLS